MNTVDIPRPVAVAAVRTPEEIRRDQELEAERHERKRRWTAAMRAARLAVAA